MTVHYHRRMVTLCLRFRNACKHHFESCGVFGVVKFDLGPTTGFRRPGDRCSLKLFGYGSFKGDLFVDQF